MEKDQICRGSAVQISAKNKTILKLLSTQLKILIISGCDSNLENPILNEINERRNKIIEFGESTGKLSKSQEKELEEYERIVDVYLAGTIPSEDLSKLKDEQDKYISILSEKILFTGKHSKRAKRVCIRNMSKETRSTLRMHMTSSRKIFNMALDFHNKGFRGEELRKRCVRGKFIPKELLKTPEHIRQKAFDKFSSSLNASKELGGNLHFISNNKEDSWVGFQHRDCKVSQNILKIYNMEFVLSEDVSDIPCDIEITESYGFFNISIVGVRVFTKRLVPDIETSRVCALDMGERTFGTLYDPDGTIAFLGTDVNEKVKSILRIIYKKKKTLKKSYKLDNRKRISLFKSWRKSSLKLKNLIKEMHHRVAHWLVQNYDVILIGKLGIGAMKTKRRGKRVLQSLSHYSFRSTLLQKATLNRKVVSVVSEAYTTKQCNHCGYMNWTIGSSEEFACRNCHVKCHRDVHSGRGIFIKSLGKE